MIEREFDLAIIGAGTGGYSCALRAAELGMRVALVEKDKVGGTCVHYGCIPTKALLYSASVLDLIKRSDSFGISAASVSTDWQRVQKNKEETVERLAKGLEGLVHRRSIEVFKSQAKLQGQNELVLEGAASTVLLKTRNLVIASGSEPKLLPGLPLEDSRVMTSNEALTIDHVPRSVAVLGGGSVGLEFASLFASFGSKVSVIEFMPSLLPLEDQEITRRLASGFQRRGIDVHLGTRFEKAQRVNGELEVTVRKSDDSEEKLLVESVLVATGRGPVTKDLALPSIGVETDDKGYVKTEARLETTRKGVFALGDVVGRLPLAHTSFLEGIYVAEQIAGLSPMPINYQTIPRCVYCQPEVASVGLTEQQAIDQGHEVQIGRFPFKANSKAAIMRDDPGFAKIMTDRSGTILGVTLIGPHVTELISEATLATGWEASVSEWAQFIHPHPTLSEAVGEAVLKLAGKPLHSP